MSDMLRSHYKPSGIFDRFAKLWYVSIYFLKVIPYKCYKICPVTAAIFHTSKHTWLRTEGPRHIKNIEIAFHKLFCGRN